MAERTEKWLSVTNVKFVIQVALIVVGMTLAWSALTTDVELMKRDIKSEVALIQKDINIINTNHLTHIQDDIAELKSTYKEQTKILQEILVTINKIH